MNIQETVKHLEVRNTGELKKQEEEIVFLEKLELQGKATRLEWGGGVWSQRNTLVSEKQQQVVRKEEMPLPFLPASPVPPAG